MIDLSTAAPKRLRHTGEWPTPSPRRALPGTALRAHQEARTRTWAETSVSIVFNADEERLSPTSREVIGAVFTEQGEAARLLIEHGAVQS